MLKCLNLGAMKIVLQVGFLTFLPVASLWKHLKTDPFQNRFIQGV